MLNTLMGLLAALVAVLFLQNKRLKRKLVDTEIKTEKEKLYDAQEKSNSARDRFLDLLNKFRKGE
jgi:biopolymer transport protein ExbB/TolQ